MADGPVIVVEVIYALPPALPRVRLQLRDGATVREAIEQSGLLDRHPEIDLDVNAVGVFGRRRDPSTRLRSGDRVEIYRPLLIDPKLGRRQRVAAAARPRGGS